MIEPVAAPGFTIWRLISPTAESARVEAQKVARAGGEEWGGGFLSQLAKGSGGSVVSSPSGIRGGAPTENDIRAFSA